MNNSKKCIHSFEVQHLCNDFLVFKRSLGFKYVSEEKILRYFTHYCEENHPNEILPEDIIYDWINNNPNNSLKTRSNHVSTITAWAKYIFSIGYMPLKIPNIRCTSNTAFIPHIFTSNEMQRIWDIVDNLPVSKVFPNQHKCLPVLFRLLYSCGLRITEALQIKVKDVDIQSGIITLYHTKYEKERFIPMSNSLTKVMKTYIDNNSMELRSDSLLFYYRKEHKLTANTIYSRFRKILNASNIPYEGSLKGPRLHDLRHTFAVTTMNKLADSGKDLYVILPILSA